ncbi:MAG: cyclic nucleotide-binding domain-containing protein [Mariprofundaceae bacterium]|nr:cyclic nucleotide-binding domain-containing protein [Mariprofundaceae bacterium]
MTLQAHDLLQTYRHLYRIFPEDIHIGRPLIQVFQNQGDVDTAYRISLELGRRMFTCGRTSFAVSLLRLCQQLKNEQDDEIESMLAMAEVMSDSPQEHSDKVFTLIEQLSDQEALDFIHQANMINCQHGETLIHEGEIGSQFYMILQGHMSVYIHLDDGKELKIKVLSDGDYFGEYACIYQLPRTATITADEDTLLLAFPDTAISSLMLQSPDAGGILMHIMAQRLIQSMTHIHPAFSDIVDGDHAWVAEESKILDIDEGRELILRSKHAYLILHGNIDLIQDEQVKKTLHRSQMFSDLNPHLCLPEYSALVAPKRCLICEIPQDIFNSFMGAYGSFERWVETQNI